MVLNLSSKLATVGIAAVLSSSAYAVSGDRFLINSQFTLVEKSQTSQERVEGFQVNCSPLPGQVNLCFDVNKKLSISNIRIEGQKLRFQLGVVGQCNNFAGEHTINLGFLGITRNTVHMEGQSYCVKQVADIAVDVPRYLEGQAIVREEVSSGSKQFVLKLDEDSMREWSPAIQVTIQNSFQNATKTVENGLVLDTYFATLCGGNAKDTLCSELTNRATVRDAVAASAADLLKTAFLNEGLVATSVSDLAAFPAGVWTKVSMKKTDSQLEIKILAD